MEKAAPFPPSKAGAVIVALPPAPQRAGVKSCTVPASKAGAVVAVPPTLARVGWIMTAPFLKKGRLNSGPAARPLKGGWNPDRLKITSSSKSGNARN